MKIISPENLKKFTATTLLLTSLLLSACGEKPKTNETPTQVPATPTLRTITITAKSQLDQAVHSSRVEVVSQTLLESSKGIVYDTENLGYLAENTWYVRGEFKVSDERIGEVVNSIQNLRALLTGSNRERLILFTKGKKVGYSLKLGLDESNNLSTESYPAKINVTVNSKGDIVLQDLTGYALRPSETQTKSKISTVTIDNTTMPNTIHFSIAELKFIGTFDSFGDLIVSTIPQVSE